MDIDVYQELTKTNKNAWAYWDNDFDEDLSENFSFKKHGEILAPQVIFLGLNPSNKLEYPNFHHPNHKNDRKLMDEIQGDSLQDPKLPAIAGGFMTDLVADKTEADSSEVQVDKNDPTTLKEKLDLLGQEEYHIICFGKKTYNAMSSWLLGEEEYLEGQYFFTNKQSEITRDITLYSVTHYAYRFGPNHFPKQLAAIDQKIQNS